MSICLERLPQYILTRDKKFLISLAEFKYRKLYLVVKQGFTAVLVIIQTCDGSVSGERTQEVCQSG